MKLLRLMVVPLIIILAFLSGCTMYQNLDTVTKDYSQYEHKEYYTKVGMWGRVENTKEMVIEGEKGSEKVFVRIAIIGTHNYSKGLYFPPNTKVIVRDFGLGDIEFRAPALKHALGVLENNKTYSGVTLEKLFHRTFQSEKLQLDHYDTKTRELIKRGKIKEGMSKEQVKLARGYPPSHATKSLESDTWYYWKYGGGKVRKVVFEDDKVASIQTIKESQVRFPADKD